MDGDAVSASLVAVPDNSTAVKVAIELAEQGIQFIELCGSFIKTPGIVDQISTAAKIPVGIVGFHADSEQKVAALFK